MITLVWLASADTEVFKPVSSLLIQRRPQHIRTVRTCVPLNSWCGRGFLSPEFTLLDFFFFSWVIQILLSSLCFSAGCRMNITEVFFKDQAQW